MTIVDDDAAPVSMSVTPLRGIVRARGRRLTGPVSVPPGSRVGVRRGRLQARGRVLRAGDARVFRRR